MTRRILPSLLALLVAGGCSREPRYEERSVVVHSPRSCPVSERDAYAVLYGGGDFQVTPESPAIAKFFLRDLGYAMTELPSTTRAIVFDISQGEAAWRGQAEIPASGPVNVLVWSSRGQCSLTRNVQRRRGSTLATFGNHFMVVGGAAIDDGPVPTTFVGDLSTGAIDALPAGLARPRSNATVTPIRVYTDPNAPLGALVAGGQDPESGRLDDTAELYVPKIDGSRGEFEATRVQLRDGRSEHGAVVLQTGETLLVGGRGPAGALTSLEIIDPDEIANPSTRRSRSANLDRLDYARVNPNVVRLASGEILVAGGFDSSGKPVPVLEWLSPDGQAHSKRTFEPFVMGRERAFVALEAGGALAVISPEVPTPGFPTVWVISADGTPEPAFAIDPLSIVMLRLFQGTDGSPVLWTGERWLRWEPWFGAFQPIAAAPTSGPNQHGMTNGDKGLALWLRDQMDDPNAQDPSMFVTGFRFAARTRFDPVPSPLLVNGTNDLVPDRFAGGNASTIRFERERGLVMGPGASAFLTDVTFADFSLELDVTAAAPSVILRPENGLEYAVGGRECAFGQTATRALSVVRRGSAVRVAVDGGDARTCPVPLPPTGRVAVGLRGAQGTASDSGARNLRVTRL